MNADGPVFVDTNVFVYAYDTTSGSKRVAALPLLRDLWESRRGCVSVQVLQELFVTLTRKLPQPIDVETARRAVGALSHWSVHTPDATDLDAAIDIHTRHQVAFWDAMIVHSAATLGCETLLSEDLTAGQRYDGVLVVDPFA